MKRILNYKISIIAVITTIIIVLGCTGFYFSILPPKILSVHVGDLNEDYTVTMKIETFQYNKNNETWCFITKDVDEIPNDSSTWIKAENNKCSFDINAGVYYIYLKDKNGSISNSLNKSVNIDEILSINIKNNDLYLPLNSTFKLDTELFTLGEVNNTITFESNNNEIASVDSDGVITTYKDGIVNITATTVNGLSDTIKVTSTSLIRKPSLEAKQKLACGQYTENEAHLLDEILSARVNDAGYASRGSVVATARFLTIEFPYIVPYFFENGRLNVYGDKNYVDGEGRYYHKGLYLSTDKIKDIVASFSGPAVWGCKITNYHTEYYFVSGVKYPNGLDCSGFVSWALYNAGFDPKDTGAGENEWRDDDLDDLGTKVTLTPELMTSNTVQVGDLIARDGHMAIVAGLDGENIYIAESLLKGVTMEKFSIYEPSDLYKLYGYVILMDEFYNNNEGIYTDMWE